MFRCEISSGLGLNGAKHSSEVVTCVWGQLSTNSAIILRLAFSYLTNHPNSEPLDHPIGLWLPRPRAVLSTFGQHHTVDFLMFPVQRPQLCIKKIQLDLSSSEHNKIQTSTFFPVKLMVQSSGSIYEDYLFPFSSTYTQFSLSVDLRHELDDATH